MSPSYLLTILISSHSFAEYFEKQYTPLFKNTPLIQLSDPDDPYLSYISSKRCKNKKIQSNSTSNFIYLLIIDPNFPKSYKILNAITPCIKNNDAINIALFIPAKKKKLNPFLKFIKNLSIPPILPFPIPKNRKNTALSFLIPAVHFWNINSSLQNVNIHSNISHFYHDKLNLFLTYNFYFNNVQNLIIDAKSKLKSFTTLNINGISFAISGTKNLTLDDVHNIIRSIVESFDDYISISYAVFIEANSKNILYITINGVDPNSINYFSQI